MTRTHQSIVRLTAALTDLEAAADTNIARSRELKRRARLLRRRLEAGDRLTDLVEGEPTPRMVELLTCNMTTLETSGAEFRAEGLTIEAIATLFGVTRQRISALLKQKASDES